MQTAKIRQPEPAATQWPTPVYRQGGGSQERRSTNYLLERLRVTLHAAGGCQADLDAAWAKFVCALRAEFTG